MGFHVLYAQASKFSTSTQTPCRMTGVWSWRIKAPSPRPRLYSPGGFHSPHGSSMCLVTGSNDRLVIKWQRHRNSHFCVSPSLPLSFSLPNSPLLSRSPASPLCSLFVFHLLLSFFHPLCLTLSFTPCSCHRPVLQAVWHHQGQWLQ